MSTILSKANKLQKALKEKGFVVTIDKKQMYKCSHYKISINTVCLPC